MAGFYQASDDAAGHIASANKCNIERIQRLDFPF
jgi:hypothetical protein